MSLHGRNGKLTSSWSRRATSRSRVAGARPSSVPHRPPDHVLPADRRSRRSQPDRTRISGVQRRAVCRRPARFSPTRCCDPKNDTTIGLTVAGAMTPAGLGGCVIEMMERGLVDFLISTGANLYHDLHYALNFTLRRGSPFLDDRDLYAAGVIRIYDVLFPATVLLETDAYIREFLVRSGMNGPVSTSEFHYRARSGSAEAAARLRGVLGRRARGQARRADLHVVARRQLDRHERRVARADERQHADDRSQPRRERGLRDHPRRQEERLRDSRRRLAEEFLSAGPADALGGLRHSQGRQRVLHPDHDRPGRVGRAVGRDAVRSRRAGARSIPASCPTRSSRTAIRRSRFRCSASTRSAASTAHASARSCTTSARRSSPSSSGRGRRRTRSARALEDLESSKGRKPRWARSRLSCSRLPRSSRPRRASTSTRTSRPASSRSCATSFAGTCSSSSSTTTCAARATSSTSIARSISAGRSSRSITTSSTIDGFRWIDSPGVIVCSAPDETALKKLLRHVDETILRIDPAAPLPLRGRKIGLAPEID